MEKKQKKEIREIKSEVGLIIYIVFFFLVVLILIPIITYLRYDIRLDIYSSVVGGAFIFLIIIALISVGSAIIISFIKSRKGADEK